MTGNAASPQSVGSIWQIHVFPVSEALDDRGRQRLFEARQRGWSTLSGVTSSRLYFLRGSLQASDVELLARRLLADPVAERFELSSGRQERRPCSAAIEVQYLPGVMDPAAASVLSAANDVLRAFRDVEAGTGEEESGSFVVEVATGHRFELDGIDQVDELRLLAKQVFANDSVERSFVWIRGEGDALPASFPHPPTLPIECQTVQISDLDDDALVRLSREGHLFLSLEEMRAIQSHYRMSGCEPTDLELETLAQTWSEHCVHKTLKSEVNYRGPGFGAGVSGQVEVRYENLLRDTIARATRELNRPWCLSVFKDNAGVIEFDERFGIAVKVETHNHPSAIEPYGGAATGIGGCIRDIMGCGLGAKPIAATDVFCLADPNFDERRLPSGVLHPRRVLRGVVSGVRDYGNRMGIPTLNGAVYFDDRYLANPLVYCGCVGLIPRDRVEKEAKPGDWIVVAGGRTGRDGLHGATFSSGELTDTHADEFSHAVQIGNAIEEKKVLDALLRARDYDSRGSGSEDGRCLYNAVTDCGAGGLSSAVGEMGAECGAEVDLEKVPLKYAGLRYDEIWISEAQERMVFAVPTESLDEFLRVFSEEESEAAVIGRFTDTGRLVVRYEGEVVGDLGMEFLHEGLPTTVRSASWSRPEAVAPSIGDAHLKPAELHGRLLSELSSLNVASKEWVIRQYDHEVQGRSVVRQFAGVHDGPSDAAVIKPVNDSDRGIAIGCGLGPERGGGDPYWMAVEAVDEAVRNVICVGADPHRVAILDNFCLGSVKDEQSMGALVRTCQGAMDAAMAYGCPFISGKDSLNNQFSQNADDAARHGLPATIVIPDTLLISAVGLVADVADCVTMDFKQPGHRIVLASACVQESGLTGAHQLHLAVSGLIRGGVVAAAHDVSDGGLLTALAEMCIASGFGAKLRFGLGNVWEGRLDSLFREPCPAYLLELRPDAAIPDHERFVEIGEVQERSALVVELPEDVVTTWSVEEMDRAWRSSLSMEVEQSQ
jgi:phosphoribosylformylglycinamidine synthase